MTPLPITLCLFTSTKQHFGFKDVYWATLTHLDRQTPIALFGDKIAHIKITPGDETRAVEMEGNLRDLGFDVLTTTADWSRGQSHQLAYMQDVVKVSKFPLLCQQPYVLWAEDDQTITPHGCSSHDLLLQSC